MTIIEKMELSVPNLTKSEHQVYECITKNPESVEKYTILQLARHFNISKSSIMRFCQKLGYSGYSEFRFDYIRDLHSSVFNDKSNQTILGQATDIYSHAVNELNALDEDAILSLCSEIKKRDYIYCIGSGKSYLPCLLMNYNFIRLGKKIITFDTGILYNDLSKILEKDDLIILFSVSGSRKVLQKEILEFKEKKCHIVLITCNPNSKIIHDVDQIIVLPTVLKNEKALIGSSALFIIFADIITSYYINHNF
ncbi:MurR/RpiR family transcriptional regulator [Dielma fastidiosa]|uniref:MurR/RpiR family transcriptional regulator n=1 Tax=Dielma fastidiosa TaxID=1034346 RepID=A0AB35US62_9FIRM|nr:MurR/RpiR family transcriptional regulator [Dielma fastidiosa]MDY5168904.1 MurR/RpiR family transcriptional regulator [Dielma fastidiosa]